ncbi:hypothetical protein Lalb_Chr04g0262211 [Lupinus albus]|uniref:Uncharacterized protein n=1 Tax=Lupinus albus TaxID=3870 RepID=A0A6A4QRB8_LUPAL|nr:hypothetical protein Lalb_Chr04g0262211 [Lupinus albus]
MKYIPHNIALICILYFLVKLFISWNTNLPLTRPKSPKLSRRRSYGDAVAISSPGICIRARNSFGSNLKNGSVSPVKRNKDLVTGHNTGDACKSKEGARLDKESNSASTNITEQTNPDISVQS